MAFSAFPEDGAAGGADLLDLGYRCAAEPGLWSDFIRKLVAATDSRSGRMLVLNRAADQVLDSVKHNIDATYHSRYVDHYVNLRPWRPELARKDRGRFYSTCLDFSCPQETFYRTEFFNDWAAPQDIHHGMLGTVWEGDAHSVQLLLQRTRSQGPYSRAETRDFNALVPHLQRIIRLSQAFNRQRQVDRAASASSESGAVPFFLLDEKGRVIHATRQAERIAVEDDRLHLHQGRLEAVGGQNASFRRLLAEATSAAAGRWHSPSGCLALGRQAGQRLLLVVTPVHPEHKLLAVERRVFAAVFIHDEACRVKLCWRTLRDLYGFTPAECRLMEELAAGHSLKEIAGQRQVSPNTLRSQLKSLFRKTGESRQARLVARIVTGPARCQAEPAPLAFNDNLEPNS